MGRSLRSRTERAVMAAVSRLLFILPAAWLAMLATGAWVADNRTPYWGWVLLATVAVLLGDLLGWSGRRVLGWVNR